MVLTPRSYQIHSSMSILEFVVYVGNLSLKGDFRDVCADKSLFSSYQVGRAASLLMGNRAHASVRGLVRSI
jgi:hypothetical protein